MRESAPSDWWIHSMDILWLWVSKEDSGSGVLQSLNLDNSQLITYAYHVGSLLYLKTQKFSWRQAHQ